MPTCRNINVGLSKPPIGKNTLFYASLDGTIEPEVGELPTWVDTPSIAFREGAYGLQTVGGLIYPLKGLDLEKPFTIAFTMNVFPDSFKGSWTGIFMVSLKGKNSSTDRKIFCMLTTDGTTDTVNSPIVDFIEPSKGVFLNKTNISVANKYRRITLTSDGSTVYCFVDGAICGEFSLAEFPVSNAFKGAPDMQIDINYGHNKNGSQKFGISEVLVAQEYLPPIGLKAYPYEKKDDIIIPKKSYFGITTQAEVSQTLKVTLPSAWNSASGFTNNYVYCTDLSNVCQKGSPNVTISGKRNNTDWQSGDNINLIGRLGEIITGTPTVIFAKDGTNVAGNWTGLNTSTASFTLGDVNTNYKNSDIVVTYTATKSKQDSALMRGEVIDSIISLKCKGRNILPEVDSAWVGDARAYKFLVDNVEVAIQPQTMTIKPSLDFPVEIVANMSEVDVTMALFTEFDVLAKTNPFITVSALNRIVKAHPKLLGYIERAKFTDSLKAQISYIAGGTYMRNNGVYNIVSTQAQVSRTCYRDPNSNIPMNGVDFGTISDVDVKPVFFLPYLAKSNKNGELLTVFTIHNTNTVGKFFDSTNVGNITSVYIPTGIFEK